MTRLFFVVPVACLTALAAVFGFSAGQPIGETRIINAYADIYVAEYGGLPTDCAAQSSPRQDVRMVITCINNNGLGAIYHVGPRGNLVSETAQQEPQA